ncbi:MAG: hypothetical protein ACERLM_13130 [Acidimicrobiales bacterium]
MNPGLRAVVIAAVGVIGGMALVFLVASSGSDDESGLQFQLGDDEFKAGVASLQAEEIVENGPITYPDPADFDQPIWVQHLGEDPERGWYAFDAVVNGDCIVNWEADQQEFVDCNGVSYLADGTGLRQFTVRIEGGELRIDLSTEFDGTPGINEVSR